MRMLEFAVTALIGLGLMTGTAFAGAVVHAPEPGTMALVAVGVGGVAAVRTLRRRK